MARDQVVYGELALDADGKILAVRARAYQALGAYWWAAITAPLFFSLMLIPSVYDIQTVDLSTSAVFTNTAPTSVYRGAGRPEAIYFIERMLDEAARVSGIDRVEIAPPQSDQTGCRFPITRRPTTTTTAANSSG